LGTFLDIEGAFNNTCYDTMCDALVRHGCEHTIVRWIRATLEGRVAVAALNETSMRVAISRGCPQVGVLSPLLWCLVVNDLITRLTRSGSGQRFIGPEPFLGVSRQNIRRKLKGWIGKHLALWRGPCGTQRQAQELISGPNLAIRGPIIVL
jgi:hypothetical protein